MDNIIQTWKWPIPKEKEPLPTDVRGMYCRIHPRIDEDLVPFHYEGETVYLCPKCGEVYWLDFTKNDKLQFWPRLIQQPYDHKYIHEGSLAHAYIRRLEGIHRHPFLEQHCAEEEQDAAELLVRYLTYITERSLGSFFRYHFNNRDKITVKSDDPQELIITSHRHPCYGTSRYHSFRETPDGIMIEVFEHRSFIDRMFDQEDDDYMYHCCRITYLGDHPDHLPEHLDLSDPKALHWTVSEEPVCVDEMQEWVESSKPQEWVSREPFGLSGYYLFQAKKIRLSPPDPTL